MNKVLLGNEKHGCLINNEKRVLEYYDLLSLIEKINRENNSISLSFDNIDHIDISYSLVNSNQGGSATITLCVHLKDGQINDIPLFFAAEEHKKYVQFAQTLLDSPIDIRDPNQVLHSIIEIKDKSIGTILFQIDKDKKKK